MKSLRDRWRRRPLHNYLAGLEPIDRATVLIVLLLVAAIAASFAVIVQTWTPALSSEPAFLPTPFELRFAAARALS
jgi:multisubunit Na+/H+ antiporter MnhE subunit